MSIGDSGYEEIYQAKMHFDLTNNTHARPIPNARIATADLALSQ